MNTKFRAIARHAAAAALATAAIAAPAFAEFPEKPITIMVGFGAGGGTDTLARLVAKDAETKLGQPIVVENVPGGGGVVAATKLMSAEPDGYTIGMAVTSTFSYLPLASDTVKYTPDDFDYITSVAALQNCIVAKADAPFDSLEDVVELSKSGQKLSFASSSPAVNLIMSYVGSQAGIDMKIVPVKGGAEVIQELLGGHMDMGWSAGIHQKYGDQLKVIAASGNKRLVSAPDVPTLREQGYDVGSESYFLMFAPKGVPQDRLQKLIDVLSASAQTDEVKSLAQDKMGFPIEVVTGEDLRQHVQDDTANYKRLIAASKTN